MKEYYVLNFLLNGKQLNALWFSDKENNDLLLSENNKILLFKSNTKIEENSIMINDSIQYTEFVYNFDKINDENRWVRKAKKSYMDKEDFFEIDNIYILSLWNILKDVFTTIQIEFIGDDYKYDDIYNKIFFGNNCPSVTPKDKEYIPLWKIKEINSIKKVINEGIIVLNHNSIIK